MAYFSLKKISQHMKKISPCMFLKKKKKKKKKRKEKSPCIISGRFSQTYIISPKHTITTLYKEIELNFPSMHTQFRVLYPLIENYFFTLLECGEINFKLFLISTLSLRVRNFNINLFKKEKLHFKCYIFFSVIINYKPKSNKLKMDWVNKPSEQK